MGVALALVHALKPRGTGQSRPSVFAAQFRNFPIVIDTGALVCVMPCTDDFIRKIAPVRFRLKGLPQHNEVTGVRRVRWMVHDAFGTKRTIEVLAYLVPSAQVCLFSPQVKLQELREGEYVMWNNTTIL